MLVIHVGAFHLCMCAGVLNRLVVPLLRWGILLIFIYMYICFFYNLRVGWVFLMGFKGFVVL